MDHEFHRQAQTNDQVDHTDGIDLDRETPEDDVKQPHHANQVECDHEDSYNHDDRTGDVLDGCDRQENSCQAQQSVGNSYRSDSLT